MKVVVLGRGKVGKGLSSWLRAAGYEVALIAGRSSRILPGDVYLLAVPDHAIEATAARVARASADAVILHCAGRVGVEAFGPLRRPGLGALHPLVSFASASKPPRGEGYCFALSGDRRAKSTGRALVASMRGHVLPEVHGAPYHAAAALVANGAAALSLIGIDVLGRLGVKPRASQRAIGSLLRSVAWNVEQLGMPEALTGPVARGDVEAVEAHRKALRKQERAAYDRVGSLIVIAARRAGLTLKKARALRALFED